MMVNLFSIFDPLVSLWGLSWVSILSPIFLVSFFIFPASSGSVLFMSAVGFLITELGQTIRNGKFIFFFLFSLFFLLLAYNVVCLAPMIFATNSHISVIFPMALLFWGVPVFFSWSNSLPNSMKSILPQGTPYFLMPLMILIEMVSVFIRPTTLSVRLTANITAGHLLLSILISISVEHGLNVISLIFVILMDLLETAVALIQSYVFFTLVSMYTSEIYW